MCRAFRCTQLSVQRCAVRARDPPQRACEFHVVSRMTLCKGVSQWTEAPRKFSVCVSHLSLRARGAAFAVDAPLKVCPALAVARARFLPMLHRSDAKTALLSPLQCMLGGCRCSAVAMHRLRCSRRRYGFFVAAENKGYDSEGLMLTIFSYIVALTCHAVVPEGEANTARLSESPESPQERATIRATATPGQKIKFFSSCGAKTYVDVSLDRLKLVHSGEKPAHLARRGRERRKRVDTST